MEKIKTKTKKKIVGNGGNRNLGKVFSDLYKQQKDSALVYRKNRDNGFKTICGFIEERTGVDYDKLSSKSRKRDLSDLRCLFYHLSQKYLDASLVSMATYMNRDHATALHAIRNLHPMLFETDKDYRRLVVEFSEIYTRDSFSMRTQKYKQAEVEANLMLIEKNRLLNDEVASLKKQIVDMNRKIEESESLFMPVINKIPEDKLYIVRERLEAMIYMMNK